MAKNIILCADGTGNKGGYTPDSNVYKMYNAIDIHDANVPQITFYDNGVGTEKNSYWRALTGAFGFGFGQNVRDLYEFLARNYEPDDQVFLFGFSRGAATIRALSDFIAVSGLVKDKDVNGQELSRDALQQRIDQAFAVYRSSTADPTVTRRCKEEDASSHGTIPIQFIGVWDTVSALGWPKDWEPVFIATWVVDRLFKVLEYLFGLIPRYSYQFYNYELTSNVKFANQALAIDDERKTFTPLVWNENLPVIIVDENGEKRVPIGEVTTVEQVWFAGVHSNVGGGYERAGLADVALDWMMTRAQNIGGVKFRPGAHQEVQDNVNVHGQLYNSRDGFAIFFRYHPREITELCHNKVRGAVKIHCSALDRMRRRTANYAPGHLPDQFDVVDTPIQATPKSVTTAAVGDAWNACRRNIAKWVFRRKILHRFLVEFTIWLVFFTIWFWVSPPGTADNQASGATTRLFGWVIGHIADILNYILPVAFEGLIAVIVLQYPIIFGLVVIFLLGLWCLRTSYRKQTIKACETARDLLMGP